jgi:DNA-binding NtrC family response regulator
MTEVLEAADRAAASPARVLITGESGVGKDLVARYIHRQSSRRLAPFVRLNCAGLTEARLEAELFGPSEGSTAGAGSDKRGKFQRAHRGTLFLDEVGDMSLGAQARLLRFLDKGESRRPARSAARVDVRVVAATNHDLNDLLTGRQFRDELLHRLSAIHLHVPPLRERPEDVYVLLRQFLAGSWRDLSFTDGALRAFRQYSWPGNVRELRNVVEQLVWLSPAGVVGIQNLPLPMRSGSDVTPADNPVADELYDALARHGASFWEHVYPMFLAHDITRDDLRELVRRGLCESRGCYETLFMLFGIQSRDCGRFMTFLAAHECAVGVDVDEAGGIMRTCDAEVGTRTIAFVPADPEDQFAPLSKPRTN